MFLAAINSVLCYLLGEGWKNVSYNRPLDKDVKVSTSNGASFLSNKEVVESL